VVETAAEEVEVKFKVEAVMEHEEVAQ